VSSDDPELTALLADTVAALESARVADEALAELRTGRHAGPLPLPPKFAVLGRVWRLGEVLIARDATLRATGAVTRAVEPRAFAANKSDTEAARRDIQRLASKGPFARGESVNYAAVPVGATSAEIDRGDGKLVRRDGILTIRLAHAEVPLATYLADRVRSMSTPDWD
jgi:hypothetical protein